MILLTDNKEIRKTIMKELIHPYVEELYASQSSVDNDCDLVLDDIDEVLEESEETSEELPLKEVFENTQDSNTEEISEIPLEEVSTSDVPLETADDEDPMKETIDLFVEPTKMDRETVDRYTTEYAISEDEFNYDEDEYYEEEPIKNKTGLSWAVLIISMLLLLITIVLCYCIFIFPSRHGVSTVSNLQEIYNTLFG